MKVRVSHLILFLFVLSSLNLAMGRHGQYDEGAREEMRSQGEGLKGDVTYTNRNPIKGIAQGVKQATVDGPAGLVTDTVDETKEDVPVRGTVQGVRKGSEHVVDNAVKGVFKVATLGYGDVQEYQKTDPEAGTDETTKFSITF